MPDREMLISLSPVTVQTMAASVEAHRNGELIDRLRRPTSPGCSFVDTQA
jgi:hypothetical protein